MKMLKIIAIVGAISLPSAVFADTLVQTQDNEWNVSRNVNIVTDAVASGGASSFVNGSVSVSKYTGILNLSQVIIKILQPNSPSSPIISSSITAAGTSVFSGAASDNQVSESSVAAGGSALTAALTAAAGVPVSLNYSNTVASSTWSGTTITAPTAINRTVDITNGPVTLFDSAAFGPLITGAELNSIFRDGASSFSFDFTITSLLSFARSSGSSSLTAALSGLNSGQIIIEYYSVPEPSSTMLLATAGGMFLLMRRRRAAR